MNKQTIPDFDPDDRYHHRTLRFATKLQIFIDRYGFFTTYGDFLEFGHTVLELSPKGVEHTLKKVGLWHGGLRGSPGGPGLRRMQHDLIRYAEKNGNGVISHE